MKIFVDVDDFVGSFDVVGLLFDDLEFVLLCGKVEVASVKIDLRDRVGVGSL